MSTVTETITINGESVPLTLANLDRIVFATYAQRLRDAKAANQAALAHPARDQAKRERAEVRERERVRRHGQSVAVEAAEQARERTARRELDAILRAPASESGLSAADHAKATTALANGTRAGHVLVMTQMAMAFDRLGEEEDDLDEVRREVQVLVDQRLASGLDPRERARWTTIRKVLPDMDVEALKALGLVLVPFGDDGTGGSRRLAFTGPKGSGKSTATGVLTGGGFVELAFADPLKQMLIRLTGVDASWFYDPAKKEQVIPGLGVSARELCQAVGTECFRVALPAALPRLTLRGGSIWIHALLVELDRINSCNVVVSDCRFPDEYAALKERNFTVVRVDRPGLTANEFAAHASEQGCPCDVAILNDGTVEQLHDCIAKLL